jgi:hypothetical protein
MACCAATKRSMFGHGRREARAKVEASVSVLGQAGRLAFRRWRQFRCTRDNSDAALGHTVWSDGHCGSTPCPSRVMKCIQSNRRGAFRQPLIRPPVQPLWYQSALKRRLNRRAAATTAGAPSHRSVAAPSLPRQRASDRDPSSRRRVRPGVDQ